MCAEIDARGIGPEYPRHHLDGFKIVRISGRLPGWKSATVPSVPPPVHELMDPCSAKFAFKPAQQWRYLFYIKII